RFGRFDRIEDSGLRFRIPLAERVYLVQSKMQLKSEFGFRTEFAGIKSSFRRDAQTLRESSMLTGDLNVAVVEWIVHYQISEPYQFVFRVRDQESTLRALSEATTRKVVGDYSVTEVLTSGREEVLEKAQAELQDLCTRYETGITVQRIELKDSAPPDPVKPSFNEVNQSEQERDRLQNEAEAQYNAEIPRAKGEAKQLLEQAEGFAIERVNRARGDVARFAALQKEYAASPRVTRARIYLETLSDVIPRAGRRIFVDEAMKGVVPMLFPIGDGPIPAPAAPRGGVK
ncbi:MAG TPA: FtsH protease activity modulator HflK, partial [Polyangia bacterium]|nr:FtsH protease activity modulator HflK [Polyangia bacterium]